MVKIRPFKGFTPKKELAAKITSPPYDVINSEEAREMARGNKYSFLHIIKSEIDFSEENPEKSAVFQKAKNNFNDFVNSGLLIQDNQPCFYLYRQEQKDHTQIGLVAAVSVEDYNNKTIKEHELTRPDKEDDRTKHIEITNTNAGPVFIIYHHSDPINNFINNLISQPTYLNFISPDGVENSLWKISSKEDQETLIKLFSQVPHLYIADGHHRSAAASRVQKIKKQQNPNHTGEENYNFFLSVIFPDNQIKIIDYNRCVKDLNGYSTAEIIEKIRSKFELAELNVNDPEEAKPKKRGQFSMLLNDKWYSLIIKPEFKAENDPIKSLDVSLLQDNILAPIFDIKDPRTDSRIDFVGGTRGLKELVKRCHKDCQIAFAVYPTGIDQLIAIADDNKVMPPKSTWFEPKLLSGLIVKVL